MIEWALLFLVIIIAWAVIDELRYEFRRSFPRRPSAQHERRDEQRKRPNLIVVREHSDHRGAA